MIPSIIDKMIPDSNLKTKVSKFPIFKKKLDYREKQLFAPLPPIGG